MTSTRFAAAVHVLVLLAEGRGAARSSYLLAASLGEDPGVTRRLIGRLRRAGLVSARPGPGGGVRLIGSPASIDLARVAQAVGASVRSARLHRPSRGCAIGRSLEGVLIPVLDRAERAYLESLAAVTLDDLLFGVARARAGVRARNRHRPTGRARRRGGGEAGLG